MRPSNPAPEHTKGNHTWTRENGYQPAEAPKPEEPAEEKSETAAE